MIPFTFETVALHTYYKDSIIARARAAYGPGHYHASIFDVIISQDTTSIESQILGSHPQAHLIRYGTHKDSDWISVAHTTKERTIEEALCALLGIVREKLARQVGLDKTFDAETESTIS
ncbi:hypothetical protein CC86DRAFT_399540 [Ophiobolus disseminans]|uniref:Uncharacterized protein n=1 Tax=Ophiobolus disseminans TaxID=1469910 RepID=A0A6A7AIU2_9PLEO|nr:hypothetical protein CC86DRAFT_399540 [Ophiobolus disseminans]